MRLDLFTVDVRSNQDLFPEVLWLMFMLRVRDDYISYPTRAAIQLYQTRIIDTPCSIPFITRLSEVVGT